MSFPPIPITLSLSFSTATPGFDVRNCDWARITAFPRLPQERRGPCDPAKMRQRRVPRAARENVQALVSRSVAQFEPPLTLLDWGLAG
jgi:hypothetical protein